MVSFVVAAFVSGTMGFSCFENLACQAEFQFVCACWFGVPMSTCWMQLGYILAAGRQPAFLRCLFARTICLCALLGQVRLHTLGVPSGEGHASLCPKWGFN
jgi:hypothetical protein